MKYNGFGERQCENLTDVMRAINDSGYTPDEIYAEVTHGGDGEEAQWQGYYAEVKANDDGETVFHVFAYRGEDKDEFEKDLKQAGISTVTYID